MIRELWQNFKLGILLEVAQLARATYYHHEKRLTKVDKYGDAKAVIATIYYENKGRYGYRRITAELHHRGLIINHKTVQRLMKLLGLICRVRMKKYRSYKGEKLYLSPILDLCSRDIVSYTISDRPVLSMMTKMLGKALDKLPQTAKPVLHSDQGWQYQRKLKSRGIVQSMSRKGNCLDNAVIENFFGLLKSELHYLQKFESMGHFKQELINYLDYYNNRRGQAKLKGLPPAIHRKQALLAA